MRSGAHGAEAISIFGVDLYAVVWIMFTVVFFVVFMRRWLIDIDRDNQGLPIDLPSSARASLLPHQKARQLLWWGLGGLWILDGILQSQPAMVTSAFVKSVFTPILHHEPHWLVPLIVWGQNLWSLNPITFDILLILIQIGLGATIIVWRETSWGRLALIASILWSTPIWIFAEGFGGLLTGRASYIGGAPGSVLLYIVCAGFLLLPETSWKSGTFSRWGSISMSSFWALGAVLQAFPAFWHRHLFARIFQKAAIMAQPSFVSSPIYGIEHLALQYPILFNFLWIISMMGIAVSFHRQWTHPIFKAASSGYLLGIWWFGQDFGVLGGVGTDPSSAPVWLMLFWAIWLTPRPANRLENPSPLTHPRG